MQSKENETTVDAGQEQETPLTGGNNKQNIGFDDSQNADRDQTGDAGESNEQQPAWRPGDDPTVQTRAERLPGDEDPAEVPRVRGMGL